MHCYGSPSIFGASMYAVVGSDAYAASILACTAC
jgi:hypothetical protein